MKINRSNYEVYFLDYLDGNLPDDEVDDFLDFLKNNPDLHRELKEVSAVKLPADKQTFPDKKLLLRNSLLGASGFDYQSVAYMEGDLSTEDRDSFVEEITADAEKERQFDLLLRTKLLPNKNLTFPNKKSLYRQRGVKVFLLWGSRVAALLLLLFGIWSVWDISSETGSKNQSAQEKPVVRQPLETETTLPAKEAAKTTPAENLMAQEVKTPNQAVKKITQQPPVFRGERAIEREQTPAKIEPLLAKVAGGPTEKPVSLAAINFQKATVPEDYLTVDEFLAQKILNKSKDEPLSFSNLLTAGLDAVANASHERLAYETNQKGEVSGIKLNTRLLGFSIPLKKDK